VAYHSLKLANSDTKLFIDPLLLSSSSNSIIKQEAFQEIKKKFSEIVSLITASKQRNDVTWRNAAKRRAFISADDLQRTGVP
jgi:hypothetical protein